MVLYFRNRELPKYLPYAITLATLYQCSFLILATKRAGRRFFCLLLRITGLGDISVNHIIGQEAKYFTCVQNSSIAAHKNESMFCQTSGCLI